MKITPQKFSIFLVVIFCIAIGIYLSWAAEQKKTALVEYDRIMAEFNRRMDPRSEPLRYNSWHIYNFLGSEFIYPDDWKIETRQFNADYWEPGLVANEITISTPDGLHSVRVTDHCLKNIPDNIFDTKYCMGKFYLTNSGGKIMNDVMDSMYKHLLDPTYFPITVSSE